MDQVIWKGVIPIAPVSKKNSRQVFRNFRTGRIMLAQSKAYRKYEAAALMCLKGPKSPISDMVNVKMGFYMPTHRIVDLGNLEAAALDVLVKAGVLKDDNCRIVYTHDGSHVDYDKENPRTEIEISEIEL